MSVNKYREKIILVSILSLFALVFCSISLVNHYNFRTYAHDLGMFNQAIYSIAHFKQPLFTLGLDGVERSFLATHFSVLTYLFAPFVYLFGSYTLLIIQIISILFGSIAAYKYAKIKFGDFSYLPLIILVHFLSIWGIYSALSFDYHNNVVGAMVIMWFIYFIEVRKLIYAGIALTIAVLSQENIALWSIFILIGLILKNWKIHKAQYVSFEYPALVGVIIYTFVVITVIMPWLQNTATNLQLDRYALLGDSFSEIIINIIKKPNYVFSLIFESKNTDPITFGIKSELHFMVLVSGGFLLFYRPLYLIMLIPIYLQKLFANDFVLWGINIQYSIEFVPILSLCLMDFLTEISSNKLKYLAITTITFITILFTFKTIEGRKSLWYDKTNTAFYDNIHYQTSLDINKINVALTKIPNNSIISVSSSIAPHLGYCDKLYHFPLIENATHIVLLTEHSSMYPLSETDYLRKIDELRHSTAYQTVHDKDNLLILKVK